MCKKFPEIAKKKEQQKIYSMNVIAVMSATAFCKIEKEYQTDIDVNFVMFSL